MLTFSAGVLLIWIMVAQGFIVLEVVMGCRFFGYFFSRLSFISFLPPSETDG